MLAFEMSTYIYFFIQLSPLSFNVDLANLHETFKALQKKLHPDVNYTLNKVSGFDKFQRPQIDSSAVNHAYQVNLSFIDIASTTD